jgi:solute carrier family 13 (sodium-dependent dicarboxylate transporter), member 2/3/5
MKKPVILLVDDEDQFRTALAKRLSVRGYEVLDVNNGEDAIKIVRHGIPKWWCWTRKCRTWTASRP